MAKQYLDEEGVKRLVRNINLQLANKVNISDQENILLNYVTNNELEALADKVTGVYHFRGSVATKAALNNVVNPEVGDVYNILETGMNVGWTGEEWDDFGSIADLSNYLQNEDVEAIPDSVLLDILYGNATTAVVDDLSSLNKMLGSELDVNIVLSKDLDLPQDEVLQIPTGKKVVLDLGGKTLRAYSNGNAIVCNGGDITLKNGTVESAGRPAVVYDGVLTLDGATVSSVNDVAVSVTGSNSKVVVNSGEIEAQESGILVTTGAQVEMNGGTIECRDNCPIQGNGSDGQGGINVVMNGGKLIAHIQSGGYTACGVYIPNSGSFVMNGGEIISEGAGLVMRAGEVTLNGGSISATGASGINGKVGDSRVVVGPYAVVYDELAKYPGATQSTFKLTIGENMNLSGTDGDIQTLLSDGASANIVDNRA